MRESRTLVSSQAPTPISVNVGVSNSARTVTKTDDLGTRENATTAYPGFVLFRFVSIK